MTDLATLIEGVVGASAAARFAAADADERRQLASQMVARLVPKLPRNPGPDTDLRRWTLIAELVHVGQLSVPDSDAFLRGWALGYFVEPSWVQLDRLRRDPLLDVVLPGLLHADRMVPFDYEYLVTLSREGVVDRALLLDGCLDRLTRDRRGAELSQMRGVHEQLAPTPAEVAARLPVYARLLTDGQSTVAGIAQQMLMSADETGGLPAELVLSVSRTVLLRPEKGLVRTQLSWLDRLLARERLPSREALETLALAWQQPTVDLQERALTVVGRYVTGADPPTVARLHDAVGGLTAGLRTRAVELLPRSPGAPVAAPLPAAGPPAVAVDPSSLAAIDAAPTPAPLSTVDEVAELGAECATSTHIEPNRLELLLSGLVRLWHTQPDAVHAALHHLTKQLDHWPTPVAQMIRRLGQPETRHRRWYPDDPTAPEPFRMIMARLGEVVLLGSRDPVPDLVATPTGADGRIDPAVLLDRVATAHRDGWQPWPHDLRQALHRLPPGAEPDLADQAAAITSVAGQALAARLRSGTQDPTMERVEVPRRDRLARGEDETLFTRRLPPRRVLFRLTGSADPGDGLDRFEPPSVLTEHQRHLRGLPDCHGPASTTPCERCEVIRPRYELVGCWPAVLPVRRAVLAAHLLPVIADLADTEVPARASEGYDAATLSMLVAATGPAGPALPVAMAYGLAAIHQIDRVAAVDALLTAAAEPLRPATGTELGILAAGGMIKLNRAISSLTDAATTAPGPAWTVLQAALPAILRAATPPRFTPDLLALAAQTADVTHATGEIDGLAHAAATATGRVRSEARRLATLLTRTR